ncbi:hypothetical protein ACHQM5_013825 [Ranunculus cassubicifolius]
MAVAAINPPSFFKVLLGNFQEQLLLPRQFIKNYHGNVPKKFILRSPTGISWMVSVTEVENDFFLCKEWQAFARDHALEAGQFLVFHRNCVSDFSVEIFGRCGCQEEVRVAATENEGTQSNVFTQHEAATSGTHASFTVTYRSSRLYNLIVPRAFAKVYMTKDPEQVTLRVPDGGVWHTRCNIGSHHTLVGGWKSFVLDNNLKDGDVCTFELVKRNPLELKVLIIR